MWTLVRTASQDRFKDGGVWNKMHGVELTHADSRHYWEQVRSTSRPNLLGAAPSKYGRAGNQGAVLFSLCRTKWAIQPTSRRILERFQVDDCRPFSEQIRAKKTHAGQMQQQLIHWIIGSLLLWRPVNRGRRSNHSTTRGAPNESCCYVESLSISLAAIGYPVLLLNVDLRNRVAKKYFYFLSRRFRC